MSGTHVDRAALLHGHTMWCRVQARRPEVLPAGPPGGGRCVVMPSLVEVDQPWWRGRTSHSVARPGISADQHTALSPLHP